MTPIDFPQSNRKWAEHQNEYLTLPAYSDNEVTISCWELTVWERIKIYLFGRIFVTQLNFNEPLQPIKLEINDPFKEHYRRTEERESSD